MPEITDLKAGSVPTEELLEKIVADTPLPWTVWTSCSYRRVTSAKERAREGDVLHAYAQRSDGHLDLSMPEDKLIAWVALTNRLPSLIADRAQAEAKLALALEGPQLCTEAKPCLEYRELSARADQAEGRVRELEAQVRVAYGFDRDAVFANIDALTVRAQAAEAENARLREALEAQADLYRRGILNMTDEEIERVHSLRRSALQQKGGGGS